jgi:hypothetical protein
LLLNSDNFHRSRIEIDAADIVTDNKVDDDTILEEVIGIDSRPFASLQESKLDVIETSKSDASILTSITLSDSSMGLSTKNTDLLQLSTHSVSHHRVAKVFSMSDDHTLHLERERTRILSKKPVQFNPLPSHAGLSDEKINAAKAYIQSLVNQIAQENPNDAKYFASSVDYTQINDIDYIPNNETESKEVFGYRSTSSESKNNNEFRIVRSDSFVARRRGQSGQYGPEAIFSRYNVSVMMTRSLGDRYGPRSCQGIPDVKSVTIHPSEHARFVLATDGFWDVITPEYVRCNALRGKYVDPYAFAHSLANKARRLREKNNLRNDDITVLVVDINGDDPYDPLSRFKLVDTKDGHDFLVDGVSTSKDSASTCAPLKCSIM